MKCINKKVFISIFFFIGINIILNTELSFPKDKDIIRIATVEYPPSFYSDGTGIAADMLTELLEKMGYDIEIKIYPLGRTIKMLNNGDIECAFLFPQTDPKVSISIPLYYSSSVFVYKKSRYPEGVRFSNLSELGKYRIGALTNSKWSIKLLQEGAGLKLDFAPSNDMNMKKLYTERIDLLPFTHMIAKSLIESFFPDKKEEFKLTAPFSIVPVCLIFSKKYPGNQMIIQDVKRKMEKINMPDILQKHFGKLFDEGIIPSYMLKGKSGLE